MSAATQVLGGTSRCHARAVGEGELVDWDAVARCLDEAGLPDGPITGVERLAGGTQNVLVRFLRDGRPYVLRRGPEHLRPTSNDAMRREMRVLTALRGSDVPHPEVLATSPDGDVAFYVMTAVEGFNPSIGLPALHAGDAAVRHAMGLAAVDAIAALGGVDHVAVGLGDLGKPEGFLERQVPRWLAELESYAKHDGYPGPDIPHLDEVAAWLEANRPAPAPPGLLHGDFHLANLLFRYDGPALAAVVDWEMSTVGDPLLDLGWLLATWPAEGPLSVEEGLPTKAELVARYAERSARDTSAAGWYEVLACFRLGIILEGTHARAFAGKAPVATGDLLHATTLELFRRAHALTHGG